MKLTPEARDAMLARYVAGEKPGPLAREYGVTTSALHRTREMRGIPSHSGNSPERARLEAQCSGALVAVYNVRLVSRPGETPKGGDDGRSS